MYRTLAAEIERACADAGISLRELARASGVDSGFIARILSCQVRASLDTYAKLAIPLGLDLAAHLYTNTGPAIRDRHSAPMLEALLETLHVRWRPATEVAVSRPSRGWIDVALHDRHARIIVAGELQSEIHRVEQLVRWHAEKAASLPSWSGWPRLDEPPEISQLLVVRRTRATRAIVADFAGQLRVAYPAHPDDALAALATPAAPWPGPALVWAAVDQGRARLLGGR
ncbi:MAG: helix-turn-helix transcriptional regulator [Chloroflexota bacterium]